MKVLVPLLLLVFASFLFFYRLDYAPLTSWDEAWYASIARDIVRSNNWVFLTFNGEPYIDHPPMGFWLMAISYKLLGINEFTTRLPSVLAGLGTVVLMYLLGKTLFKSKTVGFIATVILGTSVWYVIRVRSGNLDAIFVFFYIATVYLAVLASRNFRWFPLCMACFAALVMTKTLVGVSAVVLIFFLTFHQLLNLKKNWLYLIAGGIIFYIIVFPWYRQQLSTYPHFYQHHFVHIGTRDKGLEGTARYAPVHWEKALFYLHMGVRKWYYLWLIALTYGVIRLVVTLGYLFVVLIKLGNRKNPKLNISKIYETLIINNQGLILVLIWNLVILFPFLASESTELWHLIPTYPPLALILAFSMYDGGVIFLQSVKKLPLFIKMPYFNILTSRPLFLALYICAFFYIAFLQIKIFSKEVYPTERYAPDEVDILKKSAKYNSQLHMDRDFLPIAVYYSGRTVVEYPRESSGAGTIKKLFESGKTNVLFFTYNSSVEEYKKLNLPYKLKEKNNTFSLITNE